MVSQRQGIQQCLRRVLVTAVTRVHDARVDPAGDAMWRSRGTMSYDDGVDAHRGDRLHRVAEALALAHGRAPDGERHDVAREPLRGGLEGDARAGGVLVE